MPRFTVEEQLEDPDQLRKDIKACREAIIITPLTWPKGRVVVTYCVDINTSYASGEQVIW